jgi:hypothetical protein
MITRLILMKYQQKKKKQRMTMPSGVNLAKMLAPTLPLGIKWDSE